MGGLDNYVSVAEVARIIGISRNAVLDRIYCSHIEARKVGRNYIVDKTQPIIELLKQKHKVIKALKKSR